ncbi:P-loop NTPase fold protein [Arcobacter cryaerophilus gv. pseudocryaerophilus]|uniref:P-loop NTPase fold protein n=3 Tax=Arcobacteraceae TaxID=2808963 RepID=A0AA96IJQ8_9BACT|nr:P-loop NTPase fold protein [Arcobacter sp. AZ-2023]WNL35660.1 P-loop NTPase fold protein [Arcobacter sp. AZ-2023]WPD11376.1 P-loop NTPase fold protein [Arcobacter sp. DSM 115960]
MQNKHIKEFLNYYIGLPNPQYAVLLKGKWGSGKTHFINEYKNELNKNKQKYIYVSLYGVTSYDEIETKFLEAIYPRLYNKKTIFAGKIAKQLLKATLKIDWDGNQQENAEIEVKIPDLKPEDLLNTKDYILIFDDLERCSINIINLLGYINFFVEHQSYKVILIANEKELKKTKKYKTIKEKLIGKTFEFKTNSSLAYDSFLIELKNENRVKQNILEKQKSNILELFEKSQSNNLRALRQTLLDFERFYDKVLVNHQSKEELIKDILYWFFLFSFEIRQGNNYILDLQKLSEEYYYLFFEEKTKEDAEKTKFKLFLNKYKLSDRFDVIISFDLWKEILLNSNIQKEEIDLALRNSKYYFDKTTPSWKKLSNFYNLEDKEFKELLEDVYEEFYKNNYKEYKQFKFVASMLLDFQQKDLFDIKKDELFELVKTNFTLLFDEKIFNFEDVYFIEKEFDALDANLKYRDKEFFKKLQKYIDDFLEEKKKLKLENDAKLIIQCIKEKNKSKLLDLLEGNDIRIINYKNIPILSEINVDDLFDAFVKTDGLIMHYFGGIIKGRYNHQTNELLSEKTTLQNLLDKIDEYLEKNQGKLSSYNLKKEVKENIEIALKYIENIEIQTNKV